MLSLGHTGLVTEVQDIIVGTGQFPNNLAIIFTFGQPAVTRESEGYAHELIFYVNVFQVPTRSRTLKRDEGI